jgi:hypothetical protein
LESFKAFAKCNEADELHIIMIYQSFQRGGERYHLELLSSDIGVHRAYYVGGIHILNSELVLLKSNCIILGLIGISAFHRCDCFCCTINTINGLTKSIIIIQVCLAYLLRLVRRKE